LTPKENNFYIMADFDKVIAGKVKQFVEKLLENSETEIFDVTFRREKGGRTLRVVLDSEAGATLDECADVSREISNWLDEENIIKYDKYQLEVSTPGLERPLRNAADFNRFKGRLVSIVMKDKDETGRKNYKGRITDVEENIAKIYVDKESKEFEIDTEKIKKANLEIEF